MFQTRLFLLPPVTMCNTAHCWSGYVHKKCAIFGSGTHFLLSGIATNPLDDLIEHFYTSIQPSKRTGVQLGCHTRMGNLIAVKIPTKGFHKTTWNSNLSLEACINVHTIKNSVPNTEKTLSPSERPTSKCCLQDYGVFILKIKWNKRGAMLMHVVNRVSTVLAKVKTQWTNV